jgi:competence protein CoiA
MPLFALDGISRQSGGIMSNLFPHVPSNNRGRIDTSMLTGRRSIDSRVVTSFAVAKWDGPFTCVACQEPIKLSGSKFHINHFKHVSNTKCSLGKGESDIHRKCKLEIFQALATSTQVTDLRLETPLTSVRADVFARINGVPVAIEVQLSSLSIEEITFRTIQYAQRGIYVLWLLQWTPELNKQKYSPKAWERWIHAAYFGQVYYWIEDLKVVSYHFDPHHRSIPKRTWYSDKGERHIGRGYSVRSIRYRTPVRGNVLDLVQDFRPKERYWWEGNGLKVPDAKLFMHEIDRADWYN